MDPDLDLDLDPGSDPDPAIFVIDLQDSHNKQLFSKSFSAYYFLKVHLNHFSKLRSQKQVTKQ
jgi:hypothetical protein